MSSAPPAGKGTISWTAFEGKSSCAAAGTAMAAQKQASASRENFPGYLLEPVHQLP